MIVKKEKWQKFIRHFFGEVNDVAVTLESESIEFESEYLLLKTIIEGGVFYFGFIGGGSISIKEECVSEISFYNIDKEELLKICLTNDQKIFFKKI